MVALTEVPYELAVDEDPGPAAAPDDVGQVHVEVRPLERAHQASKLNELDANMIY
jgi:hypothetical protein